VSLCLAFFVDRFNQKNERKAKIAIASGMIYGLGPGKVSEKLFLPQSSSDFIYTIIGNTV
jgi:cell division protein FtsW